MRSSIKNKHLHQNKKGIVSFGLEEIIPLFYLIFYTPAIYFKPSQEILFPFRVSIASLPFI